MFVFTCAWQSKFTCVQNFQEARGSLRFHIWGEGLMAV